MTNKKELHSVYRRLARHISSSELQSTYLDQLDALKKSTTPDEIDLQVKRMKLILAAGGRPKRSTPFKEQPLFRRLSWIFLALFVMCFGAMFLFGWLERTLGMRLQGPALIFLGLGISIELGSRFFSKEPLYQRYSVSYVYYEETPFKYFAFVLIGLALGLVIIAAGLFSCASTISI